MAHAHDGAVEILDQATPSPVTATQLQEMLDQHAVPEGAYRREYQGVLGEPDDMDMLIRPRGFIRQPRYRSMENVPRRFVRVGEYSPDVRFEMHLHEALAEPEPFTLARWLGPGRLMFLGPWADVLRALPRAHRPCEHWVVSWRDGVWMLRAWDPDHAGLGGLVEVHPDHVMYAALFGNSGRPNASRGLDKALLMGLFERHPSLS